MTALFGIPPEMLVLPLMYAAIGFLFAALLALALSPAVHRRAERLTRRNLAEKVPASVLELRAAKDAIRAEHAMAARELELGLDKLREKHAAQSGELGRKTEALHRLQIAFAEKTAALAALQGQAAGRDLAGDDLRGELSLARFEANASRAALQEAEQAIRALQGDIAELTAAVESRSRLIDRQQHDIMALTAQIDRISNEPPVLAPVLAQAAMTKPITQQYEMRQDMRSDLRAPLSPAAPAIAAAAKTAPSAPNAPGIVSFQARLAAIRDAKPLRDVRAAAAAKPAVTIEPAPPIALAQPAPAPAKPVATQKPAPQPRPAAVSAEPVRLATDIRYDEPLSTADLLELGKAMLRQSAADGPPHKTH